MVREDVRSDARALLYEATADLFTDANLNTYINQELRSLPRRGIYLEDIYTTTTVLNQVDYMLPTGTYKVEQIEINFGNSDNTDWQTINGWKQFAGAIWLPSKPSDARTLRIWIRKSFTVPSADGVTMDFPVEKSEVLSIGAAIRAYQSLMGYMSDQKNYDSIIKPDGVSMTQVGNWLKELQSDHKRILDTYRTIPQVREMDMVN